MLTKRETATQGKKKKKKLKVSIKQVRFLVSAQGLCSQRHWQNNRKNSLGLTGSPGLMSFCKLTHNIFQWPNRYISMAKQCKPLTDCRTVEHLSGSVLLTLTTNTLRGEAITQCRELGKHQWSHRRMTRLNLVSSSSSPSPQFVSA